MLLDQDNQKGIKNGDEQQFADEEFVDQVNENEILKVQIYKLDSDGNTDQVWDLGEYLENNKDKTS